jgi:nucleoside-diphosphate-sugar epimerase
MPGMRLLVLGGTVFLGRAVARQAVAAGHEVTCAARGVSGQPVDGVRLVRVDRDDPDGLASLAGERFEALIDVSRRPSHARRAATALRDQVEHAVYVSSCSVYAEHRTPGQRAQTAPTLAAAPADIDETSTDPDVYGRCKVASELAFRTGFGADRTMTCRAGLIVGPEDESGRFDYWVRRIAAGGDVLVPGTPTDPVQVVDVRDLADWLILAGATRLSGTYDGVSAPMTRAAFLEEVAAGVGTAPSLTFVPQEFLLEQGVQPWSGERSLPVWIPVPEYAGFMARDVSDALAHGLLCRPLADTARDTWRGLGDVQPPRGRTGIERRTEDELLAAWRRSLL